MSVTQTLIGSINGEGALQTVWSNDRGAASNCSKLLIAAHWLDTVLSHDVFDTMKPASSPTSLNSPKMRRAP